MSTLNRITGDIQEIQSRIATGRNILKASDSPAVGAVSFTKDQKVLLERYNTNIDRSLNRMAQAESAIGTSVNVLQRVYELAVKPETTPTTRRPRRHCHGGTEPS